MGGRGSKANGPKVGGGEKKPEAPPMLSRTETKGLVDVGQNAMLNQSQFNDMYGQLSSEEKLALSEGAKQAAADYASIEYRPLNKALRADATEKQMFPKTRKTLNGLDEGLSKASTPRDLTVYRGRTDHLTEEQAKELVGTTGVEKGFGSTTMSFNMASTFTRAATGSKSATIYAYHVPKGSKAATMHTLSGGKAKNGHETEVLIRRGYKVEYTHAETKSVGGIQYTIIHGNVTT